MKRALILALPLALAACSHNPAKECTADRLYDAGLADGRRGDNADHFRELQESCRQAGIAVDDSKYSYGRKVGLAEYCDEGQAKKDAKNNVLDSNCLKEKVPPYTAAFNEEIESVRAERQKKFDKLQAEKAKIQAEQDKLQGDINQLDKQKASAE